MTDQPSFARACVGFFLILVASCGGGGGPKSFTVTASAGPGGSVSPTSVTIIEGAITSISITLNEGYEVAEVTGCGGSFSGTTYTTAPITSACSISATFRLKRYAVTATANTGGSITPASLTVEHGSRATMTLSSTPGYKISSMTGCGGELSGATFTTGIVTSPCTISAVFALDLPFSADAILLPDLSTKFDAICGVRNSANVQNAIAINASGHRDGRKDIAFAIWCAQPQAPGVSNTSPTINGLVVYVQNPDGSFRDGTRDLFGADFVDIGGNPHYAASGDFNRDGLDDIVFSVSREDGRDWSIDHDLNGVQPAFVTSTSAGKYIVERKGPTEWGYGAIKIDNEVGGEDVLVAGEIYDVWRYTNAWTKVNTYKWATPRTYFFKREAAMQASRVAVVGENSGKRLSLYTRDASNQWSSPSYFSYEQPNPPIATFIGWNGMVGTQTITKIDGKDFTYVYFESICQVRPTKSARPEALVAFVGSEIIGGFNGQTLTEGKDMIAVTKLMRFSVEGDTLKQIEPNLSSARIEKVSLYGIGSKCGDLNGDTLDDYMLIGDTPTVFVNDGTGALVKIKASAFPEVPRELDQTSHLYEDITGDGLPDFFYFTVGRGPLTMKPYRNKLHIGIRQIDRRDF